MVERDWLLAKRILCMRLDSMGDVLMTSPALHAIRESIPDCDITLLTSPAGAEVAALIPPIDEVIEYESPWMKATAHREDSQKDFEMISRLRAGNFDGAIIFTVFSQNPLPSALLCYLADIPLRLAYSRENPYQLLTHWVKDPDGKNDIRHEVLRQLELVKTIGVSAKEDGLQIRVPPGDQERVVQRLIHAGVDPSRPWVVIHPGATAPSRRYLPERFAAAAQTLAAEDAFQIVFTGSEEEIDLVDGIRAQMAKVRSVSLTGKLSLGEMAALLMHSALLISNNTGPAHLAAAVGCPVVDLYALTNPQHTPWKVKNRVLFHDVPCKYCFKSVCPLEHHHCLRLVSADQVVSAARELIAESPERFSFAAVDTEVQKSDPKMS